MPLHCHGVHMDNWSWGASAQTVALRTAHLCCNTTSCRQQYTPCSPQHMVTRSPTANPRRNKQSWQSQTWWCILPVLGIALCISVFALTRVSPSTGVHKAVAFADHMSHPTTAGHNSEGLSGPLDLEQCKHVPKIRMCSHQMKGASTTLGVLAALRELFQLGVRCFDIDVVTTADGQLLITHPTALQDVMRDKLDRSTTDSWKAAVHLHDLKAVRQLGGNSTSFPSAAEFLEEYAHLVREAAKEDDSQQTLDPHRMPFVFLELKGAAYNTDAIDWIWAEVLELGLVDHVALYVTDDEQPSMLAQQTHWQGLLIRGFGDKVYGDNQDGVSTTSLQAATLMSVSIKLPQVFFSKLHQAGKPVLSWVVDSPLQVRDALHKQVDGIISNDPLFLKLVVKSWWKQCRALEPTS